MTFLISWRKRECFACFSAHSVYSVNSPWIKENFCLRSAGGHLPYLGGFSHSPELHGLHFSERRSLHRWLTTRCKVAIVSFCVLNLSSTSLVKLLVPSHKLKLKTAVQAASFNGSPRIDTAPGPRAATAQRNRLERENVATFFDTFPGKMIILHQRAFPAPQWFDSIQAWSSSGDPSTVLLKCHRFR